MKLIEKGTKLFNDGLPTNFGYAFSGAVDYNIKDAKVPPLRLKEWDFYQIVNNKFSMYAIIGHVSYARVRRLAPSFLCDEDHKVQQGHQHSQQCDCFARTFANLT